MDKMKQVSLLSFLIFDKNTNVSFKLIKKNNKLRLQRMAG